MTLKFEGKHSASAVAAALSGRGRYAGRSSLYWWMWENFAELQEARAKGARADWRSAVEEMTRVGLTDRNGNPPSPETARKTWSRVVLDKKAAGDQPAKPQRPPAAEASQSSRLPPEPVQPEHVYEPRQFNIKPAVMKGVPANHLKKG
jgi:hypothetical protein